MHKTGAQKRLSELTHTHSFYALMGGFAFDTSDAKLSFLPNGRTRLFIRPRDIIFLATFVPHLIPDISEGEVGDKSKANTVAKFLVCVQALWFCVQCIVRIFHGVAISQLVLNVLTS